MVIKVVLIDDDAIIRQSLKILINSVNDKTRTEFRIFSSGNGVEGIGYVFIINPDIIIVDTTLPKYNGMEIIDFVKTNPRFNEKLLIVLHDGILSVNDLPSNYNLINKRDNEFVKKFIDIVENYLKNKLANLEPNFNVEPSKTLRLRIQNSLIQKALSWANKSDRLMYFINKSQVANMNGSNTNLVSKIYKLFLKIFLSPFWLLCQIISNIFFSLLLIFTPNFVDENIKQGNADLRSFRVKTYPTLASLTLSVAFLLLQVFMFVVGGVVIFNNIRVDSIFADTSNIVNLNLSDAEYDNNKIEIIDGVVRLKPIVIEDKNIEGEEITPDEKQSLQESNVELVNLVTTYAADKPAIIFNQKITFETLEGFREVSSDNNVLESVIDPSTQKIKQTPITIDEIKTRRFRENTISYQISPDKINWYYFGGEGWELTSQGFESSNTVQELNQFVDDYQKIIGGNEIFIKAFIHSNGSINTEFKSFSILRVKNIITPLNIPEINTQENINDSPTSYVLNTNENVSINNSERDLPAPTIFSASSNQGIKIVYGKILNTAIQDEELSKFKVRIYYSNTIEGVENHSSKDSFIGETTITRNFRGELTFVLTAPYQDGGYVTAELVLMSEGKEYYSLLSKPLES